MPPGLVEQQPPPETIPANISVNNDKPNPLYPNLFPDRQIGFAQSVRFSGFVPRLTL